MEKLIENLKNSVQTAKSEAGKLAKVVIDKTNNIVDTTKLSLAKNDTEGKINKLYQQIGEIVYKKYLADGETETDINDICIELDKFKTELDDLNEQIAELKNTVVCPSCGENNNKGNEYCSKCGTHLSGTVQSAAPDVIVDVASPEPQDAPEE